MSLTRPAPAPPPPQGTTTTAAAATALSAQTITSWEDAFQQHPLPAIRNLERDLRRTMEEQRSKLRSLVGTSYRDLLSTAERIVEMDAQVQRVEGLMGDVGRRCNAGMVERAGGNWSRMKGGEREGEGAVLATIRVLRSATVVTGRVVRKRGDALLAAKVCVLARLLWKSVAEGGTAGAEKYAAVLEELRKKLAGARKRLLAYIARSLVQTTHTTHEEEDKDKDSKMSTLHTLCAYSLLTSSAPKDVLRYFLQARFEQLESKAHGSLTEDTLLEMVDLYSQTLADTREVFTRRFGDALSQLSKLALVQDPAVRSVTELSLDVYEQWIADDVRNFHPWVRHDQVFASEVGEALASWTKQAQTCLLQAISGALQEQGDMDAVLILRRKVVTKYLSLSARLRGERHVHAITDLRKVFLTRLEQLARIAASLSSFGLDTESKDVSKLANMWDLSTIDTDLDRGATRFRQAVIARQHGRDERTIEVIASLDEWMARLQAISKGIAAMRTVKWDEDLELDLDELSDEDAPLQDALNKQDADTLQATLRSETTLALKQAYGKLERPDGSTPSPATLVRILREMDSRRRALGDLLESPKSIQANASFVAGLHHQIAMLTAGSAVQLYGKRLRSGRGEADQSGLWDGAPPLPVQPSPSSFRFLKVLHRSMSDTGSDLWSAEAVRALKGFVNESLSSVFANQNDDSQSECNGDAAADNDRRKGEKKPSEEADSPQPIASDHLCVQRLFDVLYLQQVLRPRSAEADPWQGVVEDLQKRCEIDGAGADRLGKSASDYWKRTHLLFGLLADGHEGLNG